MRLLSSVIELPEMRIISQGIPSPGRTVPRIYLFTSDRHLSYDVLQALRTTHDITKPEEREAGEVHIPLYFIRDIELIPNNPHQVIVHISLGHKDFENPPPHSNSHSIENTIFRLRVSVASLTLLRTMYRVDDGAMWYVKGGRPLDLPYQSLSDMTLEPPLFSVTFPPETMTSIWEPINEAMLHLSVGTYAESADAHHTGAPYSLRIAQQEILRTLLALTEGDVDKSVRLLDGLSEAYKTDDDGLYVTRGFRADVSKHIRDLVHHAYMVSFPYTEHMSQDFSVNSEGADKENTENFDAEFNQLMKTSGLDVTLREIAESDPSYGSDPSDTYGITDPLRHGIPLSMLSITEYLETHKPHILEMCRWDFSRESVAKKAFEKYGELDVALAIIVTTALRVARFFEVADVQARHFLFLVRLLTIEGDPYPWELGSFNDSLMSNDTTEFEEMLTVQIPGIEEPHNALYVIPSLLALTHTLYEEGWSLDNLDARLAQAQPRANFPTAGVRSLLACLIDRDENSEEDYNDFIGPVRRARETYDTAFLASNIAHVIPMLADLHVRNLPSSRGSEEWRRSRRNYINQLVGSASLRLARRLGGGEDMGDSE